MSKGLIEKEFVFFDLDGTLTDPKEGITTCVAYALKKVLDLDEDPNKLTKFIGPPLKDAFMSFYNMTLEQSLRAIDAYRERFEVHGWLENIPYIGISELLSALKAQGKTILVATSKPTFFAEKILNHFEMAQYFDHIVGSNLDGTRSHKAEVIEYALSLIGNPKSQKIIMVGDREHDIIGAHKHNIECLAVGYGYGEEGVLRDHGADYYTSDLNALASLFGITDNQ